MNGDSGAAGDCLNYASALAFGRRANRTTGGRDVTRGSEAKVRWLRKINLKVSVTRLGAWHDKTLGTYYTVT